MTKPLTFQTPEQQDAYEADLITWRKILPNGVTLVGTSVGVSSIWLALQGNFEAAILAIVAAGFIDGLDGPVARALGTTSRFGAELDSLSDLVCFGFSPAVVLYLWKLRELGSAGWAAALVFALCMQCRLARFNAGVDFNTKPWTNNFFMGVPAPAGAGLATIPLVLSFQFGPGRWTQPQLLAGYVVLVAALLVSRLPTFSSKMMKRTMLKRHDMKALLAAVLSSLAYGLLFHPWLALLAIGLTYLFSLPFSSAYFVALGRWEKKPASYSQPLVPAPAAPSSAQPKARRGTSPKGKKGASPRT